MKTFALSVVASAGIWAGSAQGTEHYLHRQIDACDFASDTNCARVIMHQILELALNAGPVQLRGGKYDPYGSNPTSFCPQNVVPQFAGGDLVKATLTYLSPCSGTVDEFTCSGNFCQGTHGQFTVLSSTSYTFTNTSNNVQEFRIAGSQPELAGTGSSPVTNN